MTRKITYDPKCEEIAEHFLADLSDLWVAEFDRLGAIRELSQRVQETCEDFCREIEDARRSADVAQGA